MIRISSMLKPVACVAALLLAVNCFAQKAVTFKMQYQPERKYTMGVTMSMDMVLDVKGDSAEAVRAKSAGALPMKMLSNSEMEMLVTTGKKPANSVKFPLVMKYNKVDARQSINGTEMPSGKNAIAGLEIKGWAGGESLFEIDTTSNTSLSPGITAATLGKMLNSMMQQIKFPAKPISVGESFEQTFNMPVPVPGMAMDFVGKTTYKLLAVANGIADFDMVSSGTMDMKGSDKMPLTVKATMAGGGKLKFNEAQRFFTTMTNDMTMHLDMKMDKMDMAGDMKMTAVYNVVVAPAK